jgi:hypothetical protein
VYQLRRVSQHQFNCFDDAAVCNAIQQWFGIEITNSSDPIFRFQTNTRFKKSKLSGAVGKRKLYFFQSHILPLFCKNKVMKNNMYFRPILIVGIILLASFSRLLPHISNFAPIGALGLFGAAYFSKKWASVLVPICSYWLSDLVLNNTVYASYYKGFVLFAPGCEWQYGAIALTAILGIYLFSTINIGRIAAGALGSSVIFFIITNFGCFPNNPLYTQDFSGLMTCFAAGIPFFGGTLGGTLVYSFAMFGGMYLAQSRKLQLARA